MSGGWGPRRYRRPRWIVGKPWLLCVSDGCILYYTKYRCLVIQSYRSCNGRRSGNVIVGFESLEGQTKLSTVRVYGLALQAVISDLRAFAASLHFPVPVFWFYGGLSQLPIQQGKFEDMETSNPRGVSFRTVHRC